MDEVTLGTIGALGIVQEDSYMDLLVLAITAIVGVAEFARRLAQKIPGKTGDEITTKVELYARKALDMTAGFHGKPNDPSALKD